MKRSVWIGVSAIFRKSVFKTTAVIGYKSSMKLVVVACASIIPW